MSSKYTLDELCYKITDGSHSSPKAEQDGKYMFSVKDMNNFGFNYENAKTISINDFEKLVKQGCKPEINDVLIAKDGSVMKHIFSVKEDIDAVLLSSIAILKPKIDIINPQYFVYELLNPSMYNYILNNFKSGTGVPRIVLKDFKKIEITIPSLPTQKKIAHILSTLDDKIELNRKMNQTLEEMASAIFKSWFVDFDPVHAKANCTDEDELENIAKELGISKAILDLFPSQFDENELGMIPKGWEVKKVEDVSEILNGHAFKSSDYVNDGIFVLRTKNFSSDGYVENANDDVYLPESFLESHGQFLCQPYDFHLVMVGASIGKTSMILPMNLPALRNQNMWCFRPKSELISRVFLSHTVKNVVRSQMGSASGSAREFFTKGSFFTQKVIIPKENILSKYEKITTSLLEKIANNQNEIQTLQKTRDTLLPKLLSGEIEV